MSKQIPLTNGGFALVDSDDYEKVRKYTWYVMHHKNHSYPATCLPREQGKKVLLLHRVIIGAKPGQLVDHINRDTFDARKENLRFCTRAENARNSIKVRGRRTSKYKGVCWCKRTKKWCTRIRFSGCQRHMGYFKNEEDAALVYDVAAQLFYNDFACLNRDLHPSL